jgi:hypothetical protein
LTHIAGAGLLALVLLKAGLWNKDPATAASEPRAASLSSPMTLERAAKPESVNAAPVIPASEPEAASSETSESADVIPPLPERQPRKIR